MKQFISDEMSIMTSHLKFRKMTFNNKHLLLAESRRQLEQWQNDPQSQKNLNLSIPLLMQNKAPDGFEDGDHIKVDLRPESVSKNYSEVEILNRVVAIRSERMSQADSQLHSAKPLFASTVVRMCGFSADLYTVRKVTLG